MPPRKPKKQPDEPRTDPVPAVVRVALTVAMIADDVRNPPSGDSAIRHEGELTPEQRAGERAAWGVLCGYLGAFQFYALDPADPPAE